MNSIHPTHSLAHITCGETRGIQSPMVFQNHTSSFTLLLHRGRAGKVSSSTRPRRTVYATNLQIYVTERGDLSLSLSLYLWLSLFLLDYTLFSVHIIHISQPLAQEPCDPCITWFIRSRAKRVHKQRQSRWCSSLKSYRVNHTHTRRPLRETTSEFHSKTGAQISGQHARTHIHGQRQVAGGL